MDFKTLHSLLSTEISLFGYFVCTSAAAVDNLSFAAPIFFAALSIELTLLFVRTPL